MTSDLQDILPLPEPPRFHSLVPNAELESLRRDAARWRAIEPHLGALNNSLGYSLLSIQRPAPRGKYGATVLEIVDKLVAEKKP